MKKEKTPKTVFKERQIYQEEYNIYNRAINKTIEYVINNYKRPKQIENNKKILYREIGVNKHFESIIKNKNNNNN